MSNGVIIGMSDSVCNLKKPPPPPQNLNLGIKVFLGMPDQE